MNTTSEPRLHLRWIRSVLYWVATTETERICVDTDTYERELQVYLARHGIERNTWTHYERVNNLAGWTRQCEHETVLQANIEFWKQVPKVMITPLT